MADLGTGSQDAPQVESTCGSDLAQDDVSPPRSQSLRDDIQTTLRMGSDSAVTVAATTTSSSVHAHGGLLGASSAAFTHTASGIAVTQTATTPTGPARAHTLRTLALLDKSVDDLVFASTPPPQPQPRRRVATNPRVSPAAASPDLVLLPSTSGRVGAGAVPSDAQSTQPPSSHLTSASATADTSMSPVGRRPATAAGPPHPLLASPAVTAPRDLPPPRRPFTRADVPVADESTATMDFAVAVPEALRAAGRRTMLDVVLQRRRSESVTASEERAGSQPQAHATPRHATAVQALLFPQGIAVTSSAAGTAPPPRVGAISEGPDLRRSLRHLLPSVRAKAAAAAQGRTDERRAQQLRTQAELADDISDFSSGEDEKNEVRRARTSASAASEQPSTQTSAQLAVGAEESPHTAQAPPRHGCTTISGLLREVEDPVEEEQRGVTTEVAPAHGQSKKSPMLVDALLLGVDDTAHETMGACGAEHVSANAAFRGDGRGSVFALLSMEEEKDNADGGRDARHRHSRGQRVSTRHHASALAELEAQVLLPSARASSASSSRSSRRRSSSPTASSSSRRSDDKRVYVDALVDCPEARAPLRGDGTRGGLWDIADSREGSEDGGTGAEAAWRAVRQALNALLNRFFSQPDVAMTLAPMAARDAEHGVRDPEADSGDVEGLSETERQTHTTPPMQVDEAMWWSPQLAPAVRDAARAYVLKATNTVHAFGKPPALVMASLTASEGNGGGVGIAGGAGPVLLAGVMSGTARRRALGGGAQAAGHPSFLLNGPPRPPPFVSAFLSTRASHASRGAAGHATTVIRDTAHRFTVNAIGADDEEREVVPAHETDAREGLAMNAPAISMVYRIFELFQGMLLGCVSVYTGVGRTNTVTSGGSVLATEAHDATAGGKPSVVDAEDHASAPASTPVSAGVVCRQLHDVMAWAEHVALAAEVNRTSAAREQAHPRRGSDIFSAAVRRDQQPSQRLRRRLAANPTALRVVDYLRDAFNEWQCPPPGDGECGPASGRDIEFRARVIDGAFGLVRVRGDLCFLTRRVRHLFWSDEAAQAYSDEQTRTLLQQSQGRGWTLLLPAAVADAVPIHLEACLYVSQPFIVVQPSARVIMSSYVVTSEALLSRATLALDHLIAESLALNHPSHAQRSQHGQKRARMRHHSRTASASSSASDSVSPARRAASAAITSGAVVVVRGMRSQTTTPQRGTRTSYVLSPLATTQTAAAPSVHGVAAGNPVSGQSHAVGRPHPPLRKRAFSESLCTPERSERVASDGDDTHERQPTITPLRNGFYDPLALGGLMVDGSGGNGSYDAEELVDHNLAQPRDDTGAGDARPHHEAPVSSSADVAPTSLHGKDNLAHGWSQLSPPSSMAQSERARRVAWSAVDPRGSDFPRGPGPQWEVPLEVLLALVHLSPSNASSRLRGASVAADGHHTTLTITGEEAVNEEVDDDETLLGDVSLSSSQSRALPRQVSSVPSVRTPVADPPSSSQDGFGGPPLTHTISSIVSRHPTALPPAHAAHTSGRSIASLFPDVTLDTQS